MHALPATPMGGAGVLFTAFRTQPGELLGDMFHLILHAEFILIGSTGNHDPAALSLSRHLNAQPLMGHEKRYETPDNQHDEPGIHQPYARIAGHLQSGEVLRFNFPECDGNPATTHFIKRRETDRQQDFRGGFTIDGEFTHNGLAEIHPSEHS